MLRKMNLDSMPSKESADKDIYYIKNKDRAIGTFTWDDEEFPVLQKDMGLPAFISSGLFSWLESRTPPKHREHMHVLLKQCGLSSLQSIINFSKGLSLTDTLWVTKELDLQWNKVSLYQNVFDEVIAKIAFDGGLHGLPFSTTSPEFGTNGMLAKCWVRENGRIYLLKTGTTGASNAGMEPYSEVLAHQVLSRLGYNHVPYSVEKFHGKLVSRCELLTSENIMLLPIYMYFTFTKFEQLIEQCTEAGIAEGLAQYLIFDYLSWNTDRHAGNIGVLLDADTYELKGMAPIYDNGCSMLNYWNGEDDLADYVTRSTPALYSSFEVGAKLGRRILGKKHNVQSLINFKFDASQVPGFPEWRLHAIEQWLQGRVSWFLSLD